MLYKTTHNYFFMKRIETTQLTTTATALQKLWIAIITIGVCLGGTISIGPSHQFQSQVSQKLSPSVYNSYEDTMAD